MNLTIVAGARPNFVKIAPIINAIEKKKMDGCGINFRLVHTGQHYDPIMSHSFFEQLGIPEPDVNLRAGGGSQAQQTAAIMTGFEKELIENRPDMVIVVGDVTSTMASTITAKKLNIPVSHVEAGIRSGDLSMPEEVNRLITDAISDEYFTTTSMASANLMAANVSESRIHLVGNTMIDSLVKHLKNLRQPACWTDLQLRHQQYVLITLHRPSNVDDEVKLQDILTVIEQNAGNSQFIFPVHPRTKKAIISLKANFPAIHLIEPLGYLEFIYLLSNAKGVITDSGGITEEATVLNIPCITMRDTTERPETVLYGTNVLVGTDLFLLQEYIELMTTGHWKQSVVPDFWDGRTAERILDVIMEKYAVSEMV